MSTDAPALADGELVTVPIQPPRDPAAYRATTHFKQSLRDRVPRHDRGLLPREIIERGTPDRQVTDRDRLELDDGRGTPVAFTAAINGESWTMIVALRPEAFADDDRRHRALTIYQGRPTHAGDDSEGQS